MPATFQVEVFHGSGPTASVWPAGGRFHRADTTPTDDDSTTFVPRPIGSVINYSWRKSLKIKFLTAPVGAISNLRAYSDGQSWGTGITPYVKPKSSYIQGSAADNQALFDATAVNLTTYTSGSPLTINAGTVLTAPATGYGTQDYLVAQVGVGATATPGITTARTLTYLWNET